MKQFVSLLLLNLVAVFGQPIFGPLTAQFASSPMSIPLDTYGAASGFTGGIGIPLLSPMELNAIIEAQSGSPFKSSLADGEGDIAGFSGAFPASFDEGFGAEKDTEFYEAPAHGEPTIPKEQEPDAGPSMNERGRDTRGAYHKEEDDGRSHGEGPPEPREPEEKRYVEKEPEGRYNDGGPSAYRSRGRNTGYDDREGGDANGPPTPEHYGSGAVHDGPDGPSEGRSEGRDSPSAYGHNRDEDYLGPGPDREPDNRGREGYGGRSKVEDDRRRPVHDDDRYRDDGYRNRGRHYENSESRTNTYRPGYAPANPYLARMRDDRPSRGLFDGHSIYNQPFSGPMTRPINPDYSGYRVITG